jgi:hypothetical protein
MKRTAKVFFVSGLLMLSLAALSAAPAGAAFGLKGLGFAFEEEDGTTATAAGTHPFVFTTTLAVNAKPDLEQGELPEDSIKDLRITLPPGLVGNPGAVPTCPAADFATIVNGLSSCPDNSAIGFADLRVALPFEVPDTYRVGFYNLAPAPGVAAEFGLVVLGVPVTFDAGVNPNPPYNLVISGDNVPQGARFFSSTVSVWGNPANPIHDALRGRCAEGTSVCHVNLPEKPFLTLPRSCTGPLPMDFKARSWQEPGILLDYPIQSAHGMGNCASLHFAPDITAEPTSRSAEASSGLDFHLDIDDEGLISPEGTAKSDIRKAVVTLPQGVTVNPSVAEGLATCSEAAFASETVDSEPGLGCPQASKVGEVEVETPLLEGRLLKGSLFVATQDENPFHSLIAIYMVIKDPGLGVLVKLPGRVDPDPRTGQLVTTFGEAPYEIPQFPFSHFRFHFREGARAPLVTPPACGKYEIKTVFTPWANPDAPYVTSAPFEIDHGVNGGPCPPGGVPPFAPGFEAGSINNNAGSYSPFYMRLTRKDGEQDMTRFSSVLPRGVVGKIAGLAKCPDAAVAAAKAKSGRAELVSPSCPESSRIGRTLGGVGVGSVLTYAGGSLYLGGPYGGDPLSVIAITPAVAGPFDAGTIVVRVALTLDPETAEVQVDGANSDPIPHILKGIPLKVRDLRIYADRPNFTLNPTSCNPSQAKATLFGSFLDVFNPADDVPVPLASRYQAANCSRLGFKPKLSFSLTGGTRRGDHPAFKAVVVPRPGDANIGKTVVTLPHSAFLDQGHIRTLCTRVQFRAQQCPAGSIYGHVKAKSPLLDETLEGPVYLRSSSHPLPDLVFALRGIVEVDVVARIDSTKGRIRTTLDSPPDAPVSRFVLEMQGQKKGLIVNSRNLCAHKARAIADLSGQNGRSFVSKPVVKASCGGAKQKRRH